MTQHGEVDELPEGEAEEDEGKFDKSEKLPAPLNYHGRINPEGIIIVSAGDGSESAPSDQRYMTSRELDDEGGWKKIISCG